MNQDNTPSGPERSVDEQAKEYADKLYFDDDRKYESTHIQEKISCMTDFKAGFLAASSKCKEEETAEDKLIKYVKDSLQESEHVYGKVEKISQYGGSIFAIWMGKKCYRLQWQSYNQDVVTMDSPAPQPKDTSGMQWATDFINNFKADKKLCYGLACSLQADLARLGIDISDNKRQRYQDEMAEDVVDEVLDYMLGKINPDEYSPLLSTQQGERMFTLEDLIDAWEKGDEGDIKKKKYFKEKFNINL